MMMSVDKSPELLHRPKSEELGTLSPRMRTCSLGLVQSRCTYKREGEVDTLAVSRYYRCEGCVVLEMWMPKVKL